MGLACVLASHLDVGVRVLKTVDVQERIWDEADVLCVINCILNEFVSIPSHTPDVSQ